MKLKILLVALGLAGCATVVSWLPTYDLSPELKMLTRSDHPRDGVYNLRETESEVIVNYGPGGLLFEARQAGHYIAKSDKTLVINGTCNSNCTVLAEEVIRRGGEVCITDRAVFSYHKTLLSDGTWVRQDNLYRPEIVEWVAMHTRGGDWPEGFPTTVLDGAERFKFFKRCEKE